MFIHAGITDSRMWNPQFKEGLPGFQFVRLDLRGYDKTKLPDEPYTDCEDVLSVMNELNIAEAMVVGCSIGAAVTLHLAALAPYRLAGMVLIGAYAPGFESSSGFQSPQWSEAVSAFKAGDMDRVAELETEMWLVGNGREADDVDPKLLDSVKKMDLGALRTETKRDDLRKPVELEAMPHVAVPTLIVVGEHDIPQLLEAAEHLERVIPDATKVTIPNSAHLPSLEQPAAFNSAFLGFLGR